MKHLLLIMIATLIGFFASPASAIGQVGHCTECHAIQANQQEAAMPAVTKLGDQCSGHGCWPSRPNVGASPDVFVNGVAAHRQGDAWAAHTCPTIPETHASVLAAGSTTVFVNGKQLARVGDPVACGSTCNQGSPDVFAGG